MSISREKSSEAETLSLKLDQCTIEKENSIQELKQERQVLERLRKEFNESVVKLHKVNRYRHELELKFKAERVYSEKLNNKIAELEKLVSEVEAKNEQLSVSLGKKTLDFDRLKDDYDNLQDLMNNNILKY